MVCFIVNFNTLQYFWFVTVSLSDMRLSQLPILVMPDSFNSTICSVHLRTDSGIADPRAWLMCAWSFSPYDADWWACKVSLDSNSGGIARLMWTQHSYGSFPTICSTNELAYEATRSGDIDDIRWAFASYKVHSVQSTLYHMFIFLNASTYLFAIHRVVQ